MAASKNTHWDIEPHTKAKHAILRHYLDAWLPIMARYNGRIVFVDGFAGPGKYVGGEPGSPLIALRALLSHPSFQKAHPGREVVFLFIEQNPDRARALQHVIDRVPVPDWVKIPEVLKGEFSEHMSEILDLVASRGGTLAPTFAFIDPFGFKGVPLELVARIVKNPKCECLINFMYRDINRFINHPDPAQHGNYDDLFGTPKWRDVVRKGGRPKVRRDGITGLYKHQLEQVAGLRYVRMFEMINRGNTTEYFLFFGTNSYDGLKKMKEAMWKVDRLGGQHFADSSDGQMVIMKAGGESGLREALQEKFTHEGLVDISDIEEFVVARTSYAASHLRNKTLRPMEKETAIEVQRPPGKSGFPPGTKIRFLKMLF